MSTTTRETRWSSGLLRVSRGRPDASSQSQRLLWRHFTEPNLVCTVFQSALVTSDEQTQSQSSETQTTDPAAQPPSRQVRITVEWLWDDGRVVSSRPSSGSSVVLEEIDLIALNQAALLEGKQQIPVSAVYRDNVVGLRYLNASDMNSWHRCQLMFTSEQDAEAFISLIQTDCEIAKVERTKSSKSNGDFTILSQQSAQQSSSSSQESFDFSARLAPYIPKSEDLVELTGGFSGQGVDTVTLEPRQEAATLNDESQELQSQAHAYAAMANTTGLIRAACTQLLRDHELLDSELDSLLDDLGYQ